MDIFAQAGLLYNSICSINPSPYFEVELAAVSSETITCLNNFSIQAHKTIDKITKTDIILVSSGDYLGLGDELKKAVTWLKTMHDQGTIIASICTGAFLLAEAGLLEQKTATTHWGYVELFRSKYPQINLKPEQLVIDNESVLCSGGVNTYAELCLYLVGKYTSAEVAQNCAMSLVLDQRAHSQSHYAIFDYIKKHGDAHILKIQNNIQEQYKEKLNIEQLASKAHMNRRTLSRRFKKATGESPQNFLHRVRVEVAKQKLKTTELGIEEVCYDVGYQNPRFFRTIFKRHTHLTPSEYKNKFSPQIL